MLPPPEKRYRVHTFGGDGPVSTPSGTTTHLGKGGGTGTTQRGDLGNITPLSFGGEGLILNQSKQSQYRQSDHSKSVKTNGNLLLDDDSSNPLSKGKLQASVATPVMGNPFVMGLEDENNSDLQPRVTCNFDSLRPDVSGGHS